MSGEEMAPFTMAKYRSVPTRNPTTAAPPILGTIAEYAGAPNGPPSHVGAVAND
jgi:hypothetical protein